MLGKARENLILNELTYKAVRSSGKGGQHINKVSSKVELRFNVMESNVIDEREKEILLEKLSNIINDKGELFLFSEEERSQYLNKRKVTERFIGIINKALYIPKKRIRTKPTKASKEKTIRDKRIRSEKKMNRRKIDRNDSE